MIKRAVSGVLILLMIFSIVSCSGVKEYSHCELVIPLTEDFYEVENEGFDVSYSNGDYAVMILRISFVAGMREGIAETLTPYEFGKFWLEKCERSAYLNEGNLTYCEYYDLSGGKELYYLEAFFRSSYAYFVVLFASDSKHDEQARESFLNFSYNAYFKP